MSLRRVRQLLFLALGIVGVWLAFGATMAWKRLYLLPADSRTSFEVVVEIATHVMSWATVTPLAVYAVMALASRQSIGRRVLPVLLLLAFPPLALVVQVALASGLTATSYSDIARAREPAVARVYYNIFPLFGIGAATLCMRARAVAEEQRRDEVELTGALARVQLQQLRSDLEPHFLFNTLNSIAALAGHDRAQAESTLRRLSELLDRSLQWEDTTAIPLHEEIAFVRSYLEIQTTRFRARLTMRIDLPPELEEVSVPPLILQPLVENAVLYGIAGFDERGSIEVRASSRDGQLRLEVHDSGPGFDDSDVRNHGIGIANIRARLRLLYGAHQSLAFHYQDGRFVARVILPMGEAAS